MSAECNKHGVDLHGDTFSGLTCPVCEAEIERDSLIPAGDKLQSAASRMAEWIRTQAYDLIQVPYEVHQAAIEADSAVNQWTDARLDIRKVLCNCGAEMESEGEDGPSGVEVFRCPECRWVCEV